MAFKAILLCASALLVQSISANCGNRYSSSSLGYSSSGCNNNIAISSDGGCFIITGVGPVVPSGIAISSDISLDGNLDVCGELPYLSAVSFENCYPTSGSAGVSYGCGDGSIGIQNVIGGSGSSRNSIGSCSSLNTIGSCGCRN